MKDKLFLLIILLLSLAIGLMMPVVEGVCNNSSYVSGGTGSRGAPVKYSDSNEKSKACKVINDEENSTRLIDVTGLIKSLSTKVNTSYNSSNKLMKRADKIQKNSISLRNLADGKDVDTGEACKQYPEAC